MEPLEPNYSFFVEKPWEFYPRFKLRWDIPNKEEVGLMMDYSLYSYLYDLRNGKLAVTITENEKEYCNSCQFLLF